MPARPKTHHGIDAVMRALHIGGIIVLIIMALLVSSCTTKPPEQKVEIQYVNLPVMVPCIQEQVKRPAYPDTVAALRGSFPHLDDQVDLLLAGRAVRDNYIDKLQVQNQLCAKIPDNVNSN